MAKITTVKTHESGIALGGIGAGSVELLPDGEFHFWQIANPPRLTRVCFEDKVDDGEDSTGALSFYVREKKGNNAPVVRKLGMKTDADDFSYRMFAWNKPVERIDFDGRFPMCDLDYTDSALSCKLNLRAVSPFVPFNSDISSTPGFYMDFTAENPTDSDIEISLLGTLVPDFANKDEGNVNSLHISGNGCAVHIEPAIKSDSPCCGDICLSVSGDGNKSYITADYYRFMKEFIADSKLGVTQESVLFGFREKGRLPDTDIGTKPEPLPEDLNSLSDAELNTLCEKFRKYPYVASVLSRILYCNPDFLDSRENKIFFLDNCYNRNERRGKDFGGCALCSEVTLKPGEKKNIRFILTWYFPNLTAKDGEMLGHYYENLYKNSLDANRFLEEGYNKIFKSATAFSELLYSTDLHSIYPDAWSSNLSPLIKCSVYHKNGKFGLWEGLGYCGLHTTDITYHASFSLISLFPDLQKKQMKMGAEYQREDGRVHHSFKPDMKCSENGFARVDINMQFVLMVLRDYLFTGDKDYLLSLWDNIKKAMDSTGLLDTDNDGLPDYDTRRNTYDAWNFSGTPVYISVLWLAALKAAVFIADRVGDKSRSDQWSNILFNGKKSLEEKLWNGEYYNLWRNNDVTDESLMTDQLDGEWFLRMIGLDGNLPDERVRSVIEFIFKNNFDNEQGLVNATVPENKWTSIDTYNNCQTIAVWTGIGYVFSSLALSVGETEISDTVVDSIHSNQLRLGHFWDHWECGHHYTRPMSSWSILHAVSGLSVDYENKKLTFKPIDKNITFPLCLPDILAKVTFTDGKVKIDCISGNINGWDIKVL
ncbi:MAG: GH116 family glycosyl hydrolase [Acutalibacteraceae bacterium]|nr:GH116 family glycosyl hydrolase [Acutalibacteraceae bacterium]